MKKIFTLIATVFMAVAANAQVAFCDPAGKEYQDGETMTITAEVKEIEEFGMKYYEATCKSPVLKNNGTSAANVHMDVDVKTLPANTGWQECWKGQCTPYTSAQKLTTVVKTLAAGETKETEIEWGATNTSTWDPAYGQTAVFTYTLYVNGAKSKTVTVNFVCPADPAGINNVTLNETASKAYMIDGRQSRGTSRINIVRFDNGVVRKVLK